MKTNVVVGFVSVVVLACVSGCAGHAGGGSVPNTAADLKVAPSETIEVHCKRVDGFDKAGEVAGDVGRWTFDEASKAWNWATSEETKNKVVKAYDASRDMTSKAYQAAKDAYSAHSK